ncbi:MAG: MMPL family transporter, partial [Clostridia bacterium]|nr:MMPL family transporter [Clostridia bacterium]
VIQDDVIVNQLSMAAIGIVLLLTFRSLTIPFILLACIKSSIYINLAVPYFTGEPLYYLSLLIINSIQLGATVDYGILFTEKYMKARKKAGRIDAAAEAIAEASPSILTSSGILFTGGTMLGGMSSVDIIRQLGFLVGRGALISAGMVVLVLPALLIIFDPLIGTTTMGSRFFRKNKRGWKVSSDENKELDEEYRDFVGLVDAESGVGGEKRGDIRESVRQRRRAGRVRGQQV